MRFARSPGAAVPWFVFACLPACSYDWEGVRGATSSFASAGAPASAGAFATAGRGGAAGSGSGAAATAGAGGAAGASSLAGHGSCVSGLLKDPGFERQVAGRAGEWEVDEQAGDGGVAVLAADSVHSGRLALHVDTMSVDTPTPADYLLRISTDLSPAFRSGPTLEGELWAHVVEAGDPPPGVAFEHRDAAGAPVGAATAIATLLPNAAFERFEFEGSVVPGGSTSARLVITFPLGVTAHLDDACATVKEPP